MLEPLKLGHPDLLATCGMHPQMRELVRVIGITGLTMIQRLALRRFLDFFGEGL